MCENLDYTTGVLLELRIKGSLVLKNPIIIGIVVEKVITELASLGSALGLEVEQSGQNIDEFVLRIKEK